MWLLLAATYSSSSLDLTLEIFCKCRLRQKIFPLASQREFVLLYNGVYPPESVLTCTRNNTSRDFNQRSTKKTKTTNQRRYKSGSEGKFVPSASSDSTVTVGKERDASKSGCLSTSSPATSPLHPNHPSHNGKNKNARPQVETKPSKCALHHNLKARNDAAECSKTQQKMTTIVICVQKHRVEKLDEK